MTPDLPAIQALRALRDRKDLQAKVAAGAARALWVPLALPALPAYEARKAVRATEVSAVFVVPPATRALQGHRVTRETLALAASRVTPDRRAKTVIPVPPVKLGLRDREAPKATTVIPDPRATRDRAGCEAPEVGRAIQANRDHKATEACKARRESRDLLAVIEDDSIDNAKLANMAQATLKGRQAGAGTGDAEDLTADQAQAVLDTATDPYLKRNRENQRIEGGATVASKDLETIRTGAVTLNMGARALQHYTNGGAHQLRPGTGTGSCLLDITNNASAGAITTTGWTKVSGSFTTTNAHKFRCHASVGQAGSLLVIEPLQ